MREKQRKDGKRGVRRRSHFTALLLRYGWLLLLELVACAAWNVIDVYGNDLIGGVIDQLFAGETVEYASFLRFFLLLVLAGALIVALRYACAADYGNRVCRAYRDEIADKLLRLEYAWFDRHNSASVLNKVIGDLSEVGSMMETALPDLLDCGIALIIYSGYILRLKPSLFALMAVVYPAIFYLASRFAKRLKSLSLGHRERVDDMTQITQDAVSGILTLRSFQLERLFLRRMHAAADALVENEQKRVEISNTSLLLQKTLQWIPNIVCASYALYLVYTGGISIGRLVAFIMILAKFVSAFIGTPFRIVDLQNGLASVQRIEEILAAGEEPTGQERELPVSDLALRFDGVRFSYPGSQEVLSGVSFQLRAGEHIAIIGESGGGKSTIFHLICGFYPPGEGTIELFGRRLNDWETAAAREQIALVSQDIYLFPTSIRENLLLGNREASMEQIIEACKNAEIHDFILSLPQQYETQVGERGALLSGGQKQRLSIARALLKSAPLLLLDEPTSAIDVGCEEQIQKALDRVTAGRSCITIAHRLSTIRGCDRVLELRGGVLR